MEEYDTVVTKKMENVTMNEYRNYLSFRCQYYVSLHIVYNMLPRRLSPDTLSLSLSRPLFMPCMMVRCVILLLLEVSRVSRKLIKAK